MSFPENKYLSTKCDAIRDAVLYKLIFPETLKIQEIFQVGKILFFLFFPLVEKGSFEASELHVCVCLFFKSPLYDVSKTRIHSASWHQAGKINLQSGLDIK